MYIICRLYVLSTWECVFHKMTCVIYCIYRSLGDVGTLEILYCSYGPCTGILVLTLCVFLTPPSITIVRVHIFCCMISVCPWCTMLHHGALGFMPLCNLGFGMEAIWLCGFVVMGGGCKEYKNYTHVYIYVYISICIYVYIYIYLYMYACYVYIMYICIHHM